MELLSYEKDLLLRLYHENALLIMARGLGVDRIFVNLLRMYSHSKYTVLCLNLNTNEQNHFMSELANINEKGGEKQQLPWLINADIPINRRVELYGNGGVYFITSRILTVDILTGKIPIEKVSGIIVYQAHRIIENCQEAFIMSLFRERNKTGFVKAISDNPLVFTKGMCRVSMSMKMLFVKSLIVIARFDEPVIEALSQNEPDVNEIVVPMTTDMEHIQDSLFEMMDCCLKELKKSNKIIDNDLLTLDNAILPYFYSQIKGRLNESWTQVDAKCRQLVNDLRLLQNLILGLTQTDPVSFLAMVKSIWMNEATKRNSNWAVLPSADVLYKLAMKRVYGENMSKQEVDIDRCIAEDPKLKAVQNVLNDIKRECEQQSVTLIVAWEEKSCVNIKQFILCTSHEEFVRQQVEFLNCMGRRDVDDLKAQTEKRKTAGTDTTSNLVVIRSMLDQFVLNANSTDMRNEPINFDIENPPSVICPLTNLPDTFALSNLLHKYKPKYIILFDIMLPFIRQIELFAATNRSCDLIVYSIGYSDSAEERIFLSTIDIEQKALNDLLEEKTNLVVPEQIEGLMKGDERFRRGDARIVVGDRSEITRLQIKKANEKGYEDEYCPSSTFEHRVIVDMREFRSELPAYLYKRGIEIIPTTLEVGDYIITPEMCIERKSISDLLQSLNNGRLFNQVSIMCRHYKRPILLIEFNRNVQFGIKQNYLASGYFTSREAYTKLALLTLHFPKLRILWCPTPTASAEMIHELKLNRDQPVLEQAMAIRTDSSSDKSKYNELGKDLVVRIPGVSFKNLNSILEQVESMIELANMSTDQLQRILGGNVKAATLVYQFFNTSVETRK